jgi:hypothetical protein
MSNGTGVPPIADDVFAKRFSSLTSGMLKAMNEISEIAKKGPSNLLMTLGATIIVAVLAMRLSVFGIQISALNTTEFMTVTLVGLVLLLVGAYLRFYQFKTSQEMAQELRSAGLHILDKTIGTAENLTKTTPAEGGGL